MVQVKGLEFATSIGVLFALKELHGFKTLQETYKLLEDGELDTMIEILAVAYNKQNKAEMTAEQFVDHLGNKGIGFLAMADIFQEVVEALMYDGLTKEQKALKKKMLAEKGRR